MASTGCLGQPHFASSMHTRVHRVDTAVIQTTRTAFPDSRSILALHLCASPSVCPLSSTIQAGQCPQLRRKNAVILCISSTTPSPCRIMSGRLQRRYLPQLHPRKKNPSQEKSPMQTTSRRTRGGGFQLSTWCANRRAARSARGWKAGRVA